MRAFSPRHPPCSRGIPRPARHGAAVVELAFVLPFLTFLFVASVDFARIFFYYLTITHCASNGATYASSDAAHALDTVGIQNASLADATDLKPTPGVSSLTGTDPAGNAFVQVTVSYSFQTVANFPGIPNALTIQRTVQMRIAPP